jgi:SAM-dependent methyltransferase
MRREIWGDKEKIGLLKKFLKNFFLFFKNILYEIGFDAHRFKALRYYPRYLSELQKFKKLGGIVSNKYKILTDYDEPSGSAKGHYFHQDLLVAQFIYNNKPYRHIDIASRIDGFVAHVASFRSIEMMDIRDINVPKIKNIEFLKKDLTNESDASKEITDSISCLHAIEHFGLGRYGDTVDPTGHIKGFNNIIRMLKPDGRLYISFPIGKKNEVHFNIHRIFHPKEIFNWCEQNNSLFLERFDYVDDFGNLNQNINLDKTDVDVSFGCGIYTFLKKSIK